MKRFQLEHIIRAGGSIADDEEIIVLGSSSILAQFPNISEEVLLSIEADVFPKNKPDMADLIDGCIGELSPFHQAFGYYAHGVGKETAGNLPRGWDRRLFPILNENTGGVTGWCLEIHDLAAGKYAAGREKDHQFISSLIAHEMVNKKTLLKRAEEIGGSMETKKKIRQQIMADFKKAKSRGTVSEAPIQQKA
jgi:hypothetical protein